MIIKWLMIIKLLFRSAEGTNEINEYYAGLPLVRKVEE